MELRWVILWSRSMSLTIGGARKAAEGGDTNRAHEQCDRTSFAPMLQVSPEKKSDRGTMGVGGGSIPRP
jgi:hypothetical protein